MRVSTARPAHARRSRRRSVGTTTRSRLGARSAGVAGVGSDRAEPAMQRKRRGDVTRHTTHTTREACACVNGATGARTTKSAALGQGTTTRSRLGARSAGVAGVGSGEPSAGRRCRSSNEAACEDHVGRRTAQRATRRRTRERRRRDRRTHDEVGGADKERRARGSALARRRRVGSGEPARGAMEEQQRS